MASEPMIRIDVMILVRFVSIATPTPSLFRLV